jgi:hypothetical protein
MMLVPASFWPSAITRAVIHGAGSPLACHPGGGGPVRA